MIYQSKRHAASWEAVISWRVVCRIAYFALHGFALFAEPNSVWAEEPPEHIAQIMERSNVTMEYYDPRIREMQYPGRAQFTINTPHQYQFRYSTRRGRDSTELSIHISFTELEIERSHEIILPDRYSDEEHWGDTLVLHEFDHVAISSDPRIDMLLTHLIQNLSPLQISIENGKPIENSWIVDEIKTAIDLRVDATIALITQNYRYLDDISAHGGRAIPDRQAFFSALYTKANLDHHEFPFTGELLDLLGSTSYREANPHATNNNEE